MSEDRPARSTQGDLVSENKNNKNPFALVLLILCTRRIPKTFAQPWKPKQRPGIALVLKLDILPVLSCTSLAAKGGSLLGCACARPVRTQLQGPEAQRWGWGNPYAERCVSV